MIFELSCLGLCVILSIAVSWTKSPFISLIYAVMLFINSSVVILSIGFEFLALVNLLVYVGALAVLFLFVIILLEIPTTELRAFARGWSLLGILGILILFLISCVIISTRKGESDIISLTFTFVPAIESLSRLGECLYIHYTDVLILNSIVLTIALFGALVLANIRG